MLLYLIVFMFILEKKKFLQQKKKKITLQNKIFHFIKIYL